MAAPGGISPTVHYVTPDAYKLLEKTTFPNNAVYDLLDPNSLPLVFGCNLDLDCRKEKKRESEMATRSKTLQAWIKWKAGFNKTRVVKKAGKCAEGGSPRNPLFKFTGDLVKMNYVKTIKDWPKELVG